MKNELKSKAGLLGTSLMLVGMISVGIASAQDANAPEIFARKAAVSNMFEIEAAKLAVEKGRDDKAKEFARDMISDHGKATGELMKAADSQKVTLPTALDPEHQKKLDALKAASTTDFDQAYLSTQVSAHEEAVVLFDGYAKNGAAGALKSFAETTLGTLRTHNVRIHGLTTK